MTCLAVARAIVQAILIARLCCRAAARLDSSLSPAAITIGSFTVGALAINALAVGPITVVPTCADRGCAIAFVVAGLVGAAVGVIVEARAVVASAMTRGVLLPML